jgi:hypothetical protein
VIPKGIQDAFDEQYKLIKSSPIHLTRAELLEGTKWWGESKKQYVPKGYDFSFEGAEDSNPENSSTSAEKDALNDAIAAVRQTSSKKKDGPEALF